MSRFTKQLRRGFTLVEIMIVVLIIGILLAIAVPNFVRAREVARTKTCLSNLKQIENAKEQWAIERNLRLDSPAQPNDSDLFGDNKYIRVKPVCPSGGEYTLQTVGKAPECSIRNPLGQAELSHVLPRVDERPNNN